MWSAEQQSNAALIVAEAKREGLPLRAAEIAVTTADTESSLTNLSGGDRDSEGLFQQRPSQGWGTPAQVTNPQHATQSFLQRLISVPSWASIAPWLAAQDVQVSAFADGSNYAQKWSEGSALADQLWTGQVAGGAVAAPASFTTSDASATSSIAGAAAAPFLPFMLKTAFILGGLGLVVLGGLRTVQPAATSAVKTGAKVASVAAL